MVLGDVTVLGLVFRDGKPNGGGDKAVVLADCVPADLCKVGSCSSDGSICVESEPGCGTEFRLTFPPATGGASGPAEPR